jgi:hypothetical protein
MEKKCRWLNKTGRFSWPDGQVGPGEEFEAFPSQVPSCFRDTIELLGELDEQVDQEVTEDAETVEEEVTFSRHPVSEVPPEVEEEVLADEEEDDDYEELYEVVPRNTAGWYNVVRTDLGKVVNEKSLRLEEANKLAQEMNDEYNAR